MSDKKELEQKLRLTDEMILIQGIVLIEQGIELMNWSNPVGIKDQLFELYQLKNELLSECTKTSTGKILYREIRTE